MPPIKSEYTNIVLGTHLFAVGPLDTLAKH